MLVALCLRAEAVVRSRLDVDSTSDCFTSTPGQHLDEKGPDPAPDVQHNRRRLARRDRFHLALDRRDVRHRLRRRSRGSDRRPRDARAPPSRLRGRPRRERPSRESGTFSSRRSVSAMSRTRNSKIGSSYFFISRGRRGELSSVTLTGRSSAPRKVVSVTLDPILYCRIIVWNTSASEGCEASTASPSMAVMTSPTCRPAPPRRRTRA